MEAKRRFDNVFSSKEMIVLCHALEDRIGIVTQIKDREDKPGRKLYLGEQIQEYEDLHKTISQAFTKR